jgi:dipeptidyl aminopeptidase/acylaminoacyl peptidase
MAMNSTFFRCAGLWLIILAVVLLLPAAAAHAQQTLEGRWEGAIDTPQGALRIVVEFKVSGGVWQGTLQVPQQSPATFPLQNISFQPPAVKFEAQPAPQVLLGFEGTLEGNKISGRFSQFGQTFPFSLLRKGAEDEAQVLPPGIIPRELLFGNPEKASPQISPDGKRLAYLAPNADGVLNVWVRTIGQTDDQVVTSDKKRGIRAFFWQWDSNHILYIQDRDGDENWNLYQTNLKTKRTRNLTAFDGVQVQLVAADQRFPDTLLVGLNLEDPRLHDVYRLNLKTGALELDTKNPGDVAEWTADNNFVVRIAQVFTPDGGNEFRVRPDARSPWKTFYKWGREEIFGGVVAFTPDNKSVWITSSVDANTLRLNELELSSGKVKTIAEDKTYDVAQPLIHPTTRKLQAVSFVRARTEWQVLDPAIQPDFDALRKVRDGDLSIVSRDLADKTWIVAFILDNAPVSYYLYDRATKKADLLFTNRPRLEAFKLASMQPIQFTSRDGLTIHGYLTLPPGKEPKNLPMILNVHGGPWGRDVWGLNNEVQWLANRGYAVLQINFRGSAGYGKKFMNAGDREWGAKMHDDLIDGKRWAIEKGYADPKKVCIYGGSYGGYAALVGVTFTPDEFACGVSIVGPSNLITLLKSIPPYWEPLRAIFRQRVGHEENEQDFLKSRSPLFKADQIRVPLLVAQGANDPRVKQAESDQIVAAARKNGREVLYLVFPDEGHGFARPENRLIFYAAAEQFLSNVLGGYAQPPLRKEKWDELKK